MGGGASCGHYRGGYDARGIPGLGVATSGRCDMNRLHPLVDALAETLAPVIFALGVMALVGGLFCAIVYAQGVAL